MAKGFLCKENIAAIIALVIIYVLLGNIKTIQANPMVPGAVVAVNMIVVVIAGILFGRRVGLTVGFLGTLINAIVTGSSFEFAAIIPHALMGATAGYLRARTSILGASLAILVGHVLNILMFIIFGLLAVAILSTSNFWIGITYETIFGIVSISIICWLYTSLFRKK